MSHCSETAGTRVCDDFAIIIVQLSKYIALIVGGTVDWGDEAPTVEMTASIV